MMFVDGDDLLVGSLLGDAVEADGGRGGVDDLLAGVLLGVDGDALVGDLGGVAVFPVGLVGDDLSAAVGKGHAVLASHHIAVGVAGVVEVHTLVLILDSIGELEGHAGLMLGLGVGGGGGGVGGGGRGGIVVGGGAVGPGQGAAGQHHENGDLKPENRIIFGVLYYSWE